MGLGFEKLGRCRGHRQSITVAVEPCGFAAGQRATLGALLLPFAAPSPLVEPIEEESAGVFGALMCRRDGYLAL